MLVQQVLWWSDAEIARWGAPHFDKGAPLEDQPIVDKEGEPTFDKQGNAKVKEGFKHKPKGMKQVLWERGLWKDGMIGKVDKEKDPKGRGEELSMMHVLENCYDFAAEKTAFQWMMLKRGHIPEMSPKCHPEVAGVGIEYS